MRIQREVSFLPALLLVAGLLLSLPAAARAEHEPCDQRYGHQCPTQSVIGPERPIYLVLGRVPGAPEFPGQEDDEYELVFQFSARMRPARRLPLYVAYTQRVLSVFTCCSAPVRGIVYQPELYVDLELNPEALAPAERQGWGFRGGRFGLDHLSNGLGGNGDLSRTWNRAYLELKWAYGRSDGASGLDFSEAADGVVNLPNRERDLLVLRWRMWLSTTNGPGDLDFTDYFGHGQLTAQLTTDAQQLRVRYRRGTRPRTATTLVDYAFAPSSLIEADFMFLLQYVDGIGETMLDYDDPHSRWLFGIMLTR